MLVPAWAHISVLKPSVHWLVCVANVDSEWYLSPVQLTEKPSGPVVGAVRVMGSAPVPSGARSLMRDSVQVGDHSPDVVIETSRVPSTAIGGRRVMSPMTTARPWYH